MATNHRPLVQPSAMNTCNQNLIMINVIRFVVIALKISDYKLSTMLKPFTFDPIDIAIPANDPLLVNWLQNFFISFKGSGKLIRGFSI